MENDFIENPELLFLRFILALAIWAVIWLAPYLGALYLGYYLFSLPLRRKERARIFLDLIEMALKQGRNIEEVLLSIAGCRDRIMGVRFYLLAAYLEQGLRLDEALTKVPRFLPLQISAMLKAGSRIGDVRKVLPACRQLLKDAQSQTQGAINYLVLLAFVMTPIGILVSGALTVYVIPQILNVVSGVTGTDPGGTIIFLAKYRFVMVGLQMALLGFIWLAAFLYLGGPRLSSWLSWGEVPIPDRIFHTLPWRRKRLERDFSTMLAVLLDAGMPEPEAMVLAGDCTANKVFQGRIQAALSELRQGMRLTEAVEKLDATGEFRWRMSNAKHGGFVQAVSGWNASLDAKAYQLEQAVSQVITTGLVVMNGLIVGFIVVSVFSVLISIINSGLLW